jgi:hypothetical protein
VPVSVPVPVLVVAGAWVSGAGATGVVAAGGSVVVTVLFVVLVVTFAPSRIP